MTLAPQASPTPTAVVTSDEPAYAHGYMTVRQIGVAFNGHTWKQPVLTYNTGHPGAVAVATRPNGDVLMIRTWRQAVNRLVWELPRGGGQHPDPVITATNELAEETGYSPVGPGRFLGWADRDSGFIADPVGYVALDIAADATPGENDGEAFDIAWFTRAQIAAMVVSGDLTDAMTLTGLALLDAHALAAATGLADAA
jgi:ADP-ribose pyrophosphatase